MTHEEKWKLFESRARLFRYIPFVDFVFAAGSMALGTARDVSDFDVIIGVRSGRIFTVRLLCIFAFGMRGWRRSARMSRTEAANRICLNHFVTPASYGLRPPYTESWRALYKNLVPLYGNRERIAVFAQANKWAGETVYDFRRNRDDKSAMRRLGEAALGGVLGNLIEAGARRLQARRILIGARMAEGSIVCTDAELRFHPDTRSRIS